MLTSILSSVIEVLCLLSYISV